MLYSPFTIDTVHVDQIDIPLIQPIKMSFGLVEKQNVVLVRIRDRDGFEGVGEASILGGPFWGSESAEGIQAVIQNYISPALIGRPIFGLEQASSYLSQIVRGNSASRSAVEMAILDLLGRRLNVPSVNLLGGACCTRIPVAWTLSTGSAEDDIAEGERAYQGRGHRRFKVKLGRDNVAADVARVVAIVEAFRGRASVIADVNQGWDENTATRYLPMLQEAGLEAIEQPLPSHDIAGILRVRNRLNIEVIADEALTDLASAFLVAKSGAASAFSLKPNRDGGATNTKRLAAIAQASGIKLYGGTALETSIGTAASAHIYSSIPELQLGSELFGPLRLTDDLVKKPVKIQNGSLILPTGVGLGVELDEGLVSSLVARRRN